MRDPIREVEQNFFDAIAHGDWPVPDSRSDLANSGLSGPRLVQLFESQVLSRQLDLRSRELQAAGEGFYTIGSSGHEGSAAVAAAFRPDDMAFLHYRDAGFLIERSKMQGGQTPTWDLLLSFVASSEDPISGGRHKVLGSKSLFIPPQTSTIASHLPKAVGTAHSIGLSRGHDVSTTLSVDSLVVCSFGDASVNHSTAQGAFNTACWISYQNIPLPLVFVCEDNGLGISVRTPRGWVRANMSGRPELEYLRCDGLNVLDTYRAALEAEHIARRHRKPVFLHMSCVRLFGHAGSDTQDAYLNPDEIRAQFENDPLLYTAGLLIDNDVLKPDQVVDIYHHCAERTRRVANEVTKRPRLASVEQVQNSLIPPPRARADHTPVSATRRHELFGRDLKAMAKPRHMARLINWALADLMLAHPSIVLAGEDVGTKGGVYGVTARLHERFGPARVVDSLLDEQSILGLAIGLGHNGQLAIPEIQFLAYLHNAEDQIRGEASTLSFFSNGQFTNPMVIRIAGLGYQKGFGGHFHNDNSVAVLRDIPGLIVACPSTPGDAVLMLRECVRLAHEEQRVAVFIEPIALYMTRDLHEPDDSLWCALYPQPDGNEHIGLGEPGVQGNSRELAIVSYGNGHYLSHQAARVLRREHGIRSRIVDLRWLAPLDESQVINAVKPCRHVLVVDECRQTGSQSEALLTLFSERARWSPKLSRCTAADTFIPLGKAATLPLPSRDSIVAAALELVGTVTP